LANDFLAKKNATKTGESPYTLDMAPGDFYLLPQMKSTLKR
jgi:hypothetical protein